MKAMVRRMMKTVAEILIPLVENTPRKPHNNQRMEMKKIKFLQIHKIILL
jgi:hypothetical protein